MNFLSVLLVLFFNNCSSCAYVNIEPSYYIGHNFWEPTGKSPDINKKNLCSVRIQKEDEEEYIIDLNWKKSFEFKEEKNNLTYYEVREENFDLISRFITSSKENKPYLRFDYWYTDKSYEYNQSNPLGHSDLEWYKNFKALELQNENTIEMFNDEPANIHKHHLEERLNILFADGLLALNNKILKEWNGDFEKKPDFNLYYFANYSDCLKDLKKFLNKLNYLVLIDDMSDSDTFTCSEDSHQEMNTLKLSSFVEYFEMKFDQDIEIINMEFHQNKNLVFFYIANCDGVKNMLLNNEMFLPLNKTYTIDYHLEQLYDLIIKRSLKNQNDCFCTTRYQSTQDSSPLNNNERQEYSEMKKISLRDFFNHENVFEYFFNSTNFVSEDYVKLERIVIDFYNMIKYLSQIFKNQCDELKIQCLRKDKAYSKPIFIDDYKFRIVKGIGIGFFRTFEEGNIKAFDSENKEVTIVKGVDYFYIYRNNIFISFESILNKKIEKIEAFIGKNEFFKKFEVHKNFSAGYYDLTMSN